MLKAYLITMVGLICFFEGLPYLACPDQFRMWLLRVCTLPTRTLRLLGGGLMVLGLLLVYWGRQNGG